jgi:hypothetical protein
MLSAFQNRVLRRIFGPKRNEVKGDSRKLPNEELHKFYYSSSIIRSIKSRRFSWAGCVSIASRGRIGIRVGFWWETRRKKKQQEDLDVGGWVIIK